MNSFQLQKLVFDALDNALENGYYELVMSAPLVTVAIDLLNFDSDIWEAVDSSSPRVDLISYIAAWRRSRACKSPTAPA